MVISADLAHTHKASGPYGYSNASEPFDLVNKYEYIDGWLRMGLLPPPREFCRHILSCRELKAESFKRCLHSVLRGVSQ